MMHCVRFASLGSRVVLAWAVIGLGSVPALADPPGGEPPPCCCEEEVVYYDTECIESPGVGVSGGSSISLTEGNLRESQVAAEVNSASGPTLLFRIVYNSYLADGSQGSVNTVLGRGWTHSYNVFLYEYRGQVFKMGASGRTTLYKRRPDGSYTPDTGHFETLVRNPDTSFTLHKTNGLELRFARVVPAPPFIVLGEPYMLTSITDRNGNVTSLTYAGGLLTQVTDTNGRVLTIAYNAQKKIQSVTDPLGRTTQFHYAGTGGSQLVKVTDPLGYTTQYTYNTQFQLIKKIDKVGRAFTYVYNGAKKPVAIKDQSGQTLWNLTNGANWSINQTDLLRSMERNYTPSTTTQKDGNGNVWKYTYNANGQPTQVVAPDGGVTTYTYDPATLNVQTMTDPLGHTTQYTYDSVGNVIQQVDSLGNVTQYTYEPVFNQRTSLTDADGHVTTWEYDAEGNRVKETDAAGNIREWTYDTHGNVLSETDRNGNVATFVYDAFGNQVQATDPLGFSTGMTYDAVGNLLSMTDALGRTTTYAYDALNRRTSTVDPLGGVTQTLYDGAGSIVQVVDPNGHATTFEYDLRDRLVKQTDPLGHFETRAYDANNNITEMTDRNGHTTQYVYDNVNRLVQVIDALGNTVEMTYDLAGNKVSETDANGRTTTFAYDNLDRRILIADPLGATTEFEYDNGGSGGGCCGGAAGLDLISKQTDANGRVTYFKYDSLHRLIQEIRKAGDTADVIDADDAVTSYVYDPNGNAILVTDPNGLVTTYQYDALDRMTHETNPEGETVLTTYDAVGNPSTTATPGGNTLVYTYDGNNRLIRVDDDLGRVADFAYDPAGNLILEADGNGNATTYEYDAADRQVRQIDALGNAVEQAYDPVGNRVSMTDREGHTTTYTYDAVNRLDSITDSLGHATAMVYDPAGNPLSITDALGNTTQYAYDPVNRLVEETFADGGVRAYTYDPVGNLVTRTDQKGDVTAYVYNDLDFLVERDYAHDADDVFSYDLTGRMLTADKDGWLVTFTYDGADRLVQSVQNGEPVDYVYNTPGRTRTVLYPGGLVIEESRDVRERLSEITDTSGPSVLTDYTYDLGNRVTTRNALNGVVAQYAYNPNNWVLELTHTAGVDLIAGFRYDYDADGNKLFEERLHDTDRSEAFSYDALHRIVNYEVGELSAGNIPLPDTQTAYTLDALGNWDSKVTDAVLEDRNHNEVNEVIAIDGAPLLYDANGNLVDDGEFLYAWDDENRLSTVTRKSDTLVIAQYQYDALGRRVVKQVSLAGPVEETRFVYDAFRVIEEQDALGSTQREYVYGNYVDEVVALREAGQYRFLHQNRLYSVAALTDAAADVVETYVYDAYGQPSVFAGDGTPKGAPEQPYGFTGREWDEETGLWYFRTRHYDSVLGRYISRDPWVIDVRRPNPGDGYNDGMNQYRAYFVPNQTDWTGLVIHYIYTRETWNLYVDPWLWPNWWEKDVGNTRNVAEVDTQDCCKLEYRGYTDYSTPDYQFKYRGPLTSIQHSFDTAASASVSSGACKCKGKKVDGLEVKVHHVYRSGGTVTIEVSAEVGAEVGINKTSNVSGKLGLTVTIPPAEEQSEVVYRYLVCPTGDAEDPPTVNLIARTPNLHSQHSINGSAGPFLAELKGWTP